MGNMVSRTFRKKMTMTKVEKARELGFCFGVRRAIKIIHEAARKNGKVVTLGPIVHNRQVVEKLSELGVNVVNDISQSRGRVIAISSHGVSPQLLEQIEAQRLEVIDTTCPIVRSAQKAARKLAQSGFGIVIYGEASHPEVKGLLGWAGEKAIATLNGEELIEKDLPKKLGVLSQTTRGRQQFAEFVKNVISVVFPHVQELRVINTLCEETQKRQKAALELAGKSDLMIVVGGLNSANTLRLAEVCSPEVETHLIETADEIDRVWLEGKKHIGITAGASAPDEAIEEVVARLEMFTSGQGHIQPS
jgi:4-hydroxy-3-methylbut-2-enyl diphosphate reductase